MSSLMASSAPGHKVHEEPQFSRAVSSALQDMGKSSPMKLEAQQKENSTASILSSSPPFRDNKISPAEGSLAAISTGDEGGIDLIGEPCAPFP